jgi:hypothetical protein
MRDPSSSRTLFALATGIMLVCWTATDAKAQGGPPFFGGGVVGFDPEISVVNTGALLDAQVVVSDDRRYVTINARPSLSHLNSLQVFQTQASRLQGGGGGGGGGGAAGGGGGAGPGGTSLGFVGGAGFLEYVDELADVNALLSNANGSSQQVASTAAREKAGASANPGARVASNATDHVKTSPSEILKTDATAANSFLRQEGMFLLPPVRSSS